MRRSNPLFPDSRNNLCAKLSKNGSIFCLRAVAAAYKILCIHSTQVDSRLNELGVHKLVPIISSTRYQSKKSFLLKRFLSMSCEEFVPSLCVYYTRNGAYEILQMNRDPTSRGDNRVTGFFFLKTQFSDNSSCIDTRIIDAGKLKVLRRRSQKLRSKSV